MRGRARDWLRRRLRALSALTRRISCGELPDKPAGEAGGPRLAVRMGVDGAATRAAVPLARLPRGFGWMCAFGPKVQADGAAFAAWLGEPAMRAMMAAAPESMARVVGPILTATGQPTPEWFPRRAKRVKHNSVACGEKPEREADDPHSGKVVVPVIESRGCASLPAPPARGGENRKYAQRSISLRCRDAFRRGETSSKRRWAVFRFSRSSSGICIESHKREFGMAGYARPNRCHTKTKSTPHAARFRLSCDHIAESESTRCSMSASVCSGEGVMRSRSVPRGTVGKLIGCT